MNISFQPKPGGDPTVSNGLKVNYPPAKRVFPKWRWGAILILALSPLLLFTGHALWSFLRIEGRGLLVSATHEIGTGQDVRLDSVWVKVGQRVDSGQALAYWSSLAWEPAVATSVASPSAAIRIDWENLKERLRIAREAVDLARGQEEQIRWLRDQGAATEAEWNNARAYTLRARMELAALLQEWSQSQPIASPRSAVAQTRPAIDRILRAPKAGIVLSIQGTGRPIRREEPLVVLQDHPQRWSVQAFLDPSHLSRFEIGQKATLRLPDGTGIPGHIIRTGAATDSARLGAWEMLRWDRRLLVLDLALDDTLPVAARIQGLPVTTEFWRFLP